MDIARAGLGRTIFYRHFDDLGDLHLRAATESIESLYEAQVELDAERQEGDLETVRAAVEPAVRVYQRHGPTLRAVTEAGASNPEIAARGAELRRRFNQLAADSLARLPGLRENPPARRLREREGAQPAERGLPARCLRSRAAYLARDRRPDADGDLGGLPRPQRAARELLMAVEPTPEQLAEMQAIADGPGDGPLVMLNLNRYRDPAAYGRYGEVAQRVLERVGGRVLWHASIAGTVIGEGEERFDDVIAVWYPSAAAFLQLVADPETLGARADRLEGLERAAILRCEAEAEPAPSGLAP